MESLNLNYLAEDELISINSISGGGRLQWVELKRGMLYFTKERNEEILQKMIEKKIVTSDYRLTKYGIYLTGLVQQYRESDTYCKLNHERIALTRHGKTIIVQPKDKGYVIAEIPREVLLYRIMKAYPSLWEGAEDSERVEYLFVRKWKYGREQKNMVFFWNGADKYVCNRNTKEQRKTSDVEIRKKLIELLEMGVE